MNYYLQKYVGTYRVKAAIDQSTNDFCRDVHGNLENNMDIWIQCANHIKIFHYGGDTLQIYIPSIGRGRNIVRSIYRDYINPDNTKVSTAFMVKDGVQYTKEAISVINKKLYQKEMQINKGLYQKEIPKNRIIFNIEETDGEVLFLIRDKDLDKIIDRLKPQTAGAGRNPFSRRNLPKGNTYEYIVEQKEAYYSIIGQLDSKLAVGRINNWFLKDVVCKKSGQDLSFVKADIKKKCMKDRDYIYSEGYENEYLKYLKVKLNELSEGKA
ncbi:MAG: hypothetical protein K1W19_07685 [Lachnospiraceae bacterium]